MAEEEETRPGFLHYLIWFLGGVVVGALWRAKLLFGVIWLLALFIMLQVSTASPSGRTAQGTNSVETCRWLFGAAFLVWLVLRLRRLVINSRAVDGNAALAWESIGRAATSGVSRIRRGDGV